MLGRDSCLLQADCAKPYDLEGNVCCGTQRKLYRRFPFRPLRRIGLRHVPHSVNLDDGFSLDRFEQLFLNIAQDRARGNERRSVRGGV